MKVQAAPQISWSMDCMLLLTLRVVAEAPIVTVAQVPVQLHTCSQD